MTTIDQRILIPAPPDVVWKYVSDISKNTQWQAGCQSISFLTSKRDGSGARWRYTTDKRRDYVIEITAWYDGLGYEYTYVDGVPYRENVGRIRLQEIPEGTVVQWTFRYETGGFLGGMRGSGPQMQPMMVASLKALYRQINQTGAKQNPDESPSLMRDAPDADARANYKPRHPSAFESKVAETKPQQRIFPVIPEPPVAEDDTRPRVAAEQMPTQPIQEPVRAEEEPDFLVGLPRFAPPSSSTPPPIAETEEPDFLVDLSSYAPQSSASDLQSEISRFAPPEPVADTQPIKPIQEPTADTQHDSQVTQQFVEPVPDNEFTATAPVVTDFVLPPHALADETIAPADESSIAQAASEPKAADTQETESTFLPTTTLPAESAVSEPAVNPLTDSAKLSIWEVFGVARPSETQETSAAVIAEAQEEINAAEVSASSEAAPPAVSMQSPTLWTSRRGMRLLLRRNLVRLRRVT